VIYSSVPRRSCQIQLNHMHCTDRVMQILQNSDEPWAHWLGQSDPLQSVPGLIIPHCDGLAHPGLWGPLGCEHRNPNPPGHGHGHTKAGKKNHLPANAGELG
jgi:hypothetical protein